MRIGQSVAKTAVRFAAGILNLKATQAAHFPRFSFFSCHPVILVHQQRRLVNQQLCGHRLHRGIIAAVIRPNLKGAVDIASGQTEVVLRITHKHRAERHVKQVCAVEHQPVTVPLLCVFRFDGQLLQGSLGSSQVRWFVQLDHLQSPEISVSLLMPGHHFLRRQRLHRRQLAAVNRGRDGE
ncbi:hypothetical protein D3C75_862570 [compost metagenome]